MTEYQPMAYMDNLELVALAGVELIRRKTVTYGDSWKRRGGAGAWFTTVRPWDRLEGIVARHDGDILKAVAMDLEGEDGSALACIRDIRNYLILIEAEAMSIAQSRGLDMPLAVGTSLCHGMSTLSDDHPLAAVGTETPDRQPLPPGTPERRRALEGLPVLLQNALIVAGLGDARINQLPDNSSRAMAGVIVLEIVIDVR